MEAKNTFKIKIKVSKKEASILSEALFKVLAIESSISPNVIRSLNDNEVKILKELLKIFNKQLGV